MSNIKFSLQVQFHSEDRSSKFFQNTDTYLSDHTHHIPEPHTLNIQHCVNSSFNINLVSVHTIVMQYHLQQSGSSQNDRNHDIYSKEILFT